MPNVYTTLYNLIVGIGEMQENGFKSIPEKLDLGFHQFVYLNGLSDVEPPTTIPKLISILHRPAKEWGIQDIEDFFPLESTLLDIDFGISFEADEFLEVMKNPLEFEQASMKKIFKYCRKHNLQKTYVRIRTFLSNPNNSVITMSKYYQFISNLKHESLIENFKSCYEVISDLNNYKVCPHCKWTLERKNGRWRCNSGGTCHRQTEFMMFRNFEPFDEQVLRMKKGIHRYTLLPGIAEHRIAKRLRRKGYRTSMYPRVDEADILVEKDEKELILDVKDHYSPFYFVKHIENKYKDKDLKEVWFVIPQARLDEFPSYISQAKDYCFRKINVLSENELYQRIGDLLS